MKLTKLIIPIAIGLILLLHEFSNLSIGSLIPIAELFFLSLFIVLLIIAIVYIVKDIIRYKKSKRVSSFLPSIICLIIIFILIGHNNYRINNDASESLVNIGQKGKIAGRESTQFDFKKNGSLKITAQYKFTTDYFWGNYRMQGDTLFLDIKPNFTIGKKAILRTNSFKFLDDTTNNSSYFFYGEGFSK